MSPQERNTFSTASEMLTLNNPSQARRAQCGVKEPDTSVSERRALKIMWHKSVLSFFHNFKH